MSRVTGSEYYCTACRELVGIHPHRHRKEEHDGAMQPDIIRVVSSEDGQYVAKDDDMGHYGPHTWVQIEDHETCPDCGAVKVPTEVAAP